MKVIIQVKTSTGKYKTYVREFDDDKHYDNWISFMEGRGCKVVGVWEDR